MATRNWELEHGPETSVSSATLNFLTEDDARGESSDDLVDSKDGIDKDDDVADEDDDDEKDRKFLKNTSTVSGVTATGLGAYMPKYSPDHSSMENLLTADGFGGGVFAGEPEHVVRRPPSPPMRYRGSGGSYEDEEEEDDDLSIRPMDGGHGWSSSTVAADILF